MSTEEQVEQIKDRVNDFSDELTLFELKVLTKYFGKLSKDCERFASDFPEVRVSYDDVAASIDLWYAGQIQEIIEEHKQFGDDT